MKYVIKKFPVKHLSSHNPLLLCYLISIVFISCKKDTVPAVADNGKGNPTSYLLEQITDGGRGGLGGLDYYFQYNTNNLVSEIKRVQWGYVTTNNDPPVRQENTITYSFEYVNKLAVRCTQKEWFGYWTFDYYYVGDQVAKKIIRYADGTVQDSTLYSYNSDGNVTEAVVYKSNAKYKSEFVYGNNLITQTSYLLNANPPQKYRSEYSEFDNKINFVRAINGLPGTIGGDEFSGSFNATSASGNYTKGMYSNIIGISDNFGSFNTDNYTYEYNEEGLPTRMHVNGLTTIFKYRKYK